MVRKGNNKMKRQKPVMVLRESEFDYQAKVNDVVVTIQKDKIIIKDNIKIHPRIAAIENAAREANIKEWTLFNA